MVERIRGEWVHRLVRTKLSKVRRVIAPVHPNMTEIKFVLRNECSTMHYPLTYPRVPSPRSQLNIQLSCLYACVHV